MATKHFGEITSNLTGNGGSYLKVKEDETGFEFQKTEPVGDWIQSYGYYVGDLVIVSLQVYRCKTQHTSSSVFANDSVKWDNVSIAGPTGETGALGPTGSTGAVGPTGATGSAGSAFQWSASEQTYPFEKNSAGNTLYAVEIDLGTLPNNGSKSVAHGISSFDATKVFRVEGLASSNTYSGSNKIAIQLGWATTVASSALQLYLYNSNIELLTGQNLSALSGKLRIYYSK